MDVEINWVGILAAVAATMAVGMFWYSESVFGKAWSAITKVDDKEMRKRMPQAMPQVIVAALLTSYIIAHVAYVSHIFFNTTYLSASLTTAFWLWLGISATTIVAHNAFEQRPTKLILINLGNRLATYLAIGLVIGLIGL